MLVGLMLYLFDYCSDIYVAYRYWQNGDIWWYGLTVGFIVVPSIIVNTKAFIELVDYWSCLAATLQLSIVVRYVETMRVPDSSRIYSLAKLRYLETITESAPQWCLQSYIMLRQWKFPTYTVVSIVLSLLSLAWSITSLEKARCDKRREETANWTIRYEESSSSRRRDDSQSQITTFLEPTIPELRREKFNVYYGLCFLMWQLCTLISRLPAIAMFMYVFRQYVFILLGIHYLIQAAEILIIQVALEHKFCPSLLWSLLASFPTLFHASQTVFLTAKPRIEMIVGYILIVLETIAMVILSLTFEMPDAPHMDVLKPITIGLITGGLTFSVIFAVNLYCFLSTIQNNDPCTTVLCRRSEIISQPS